MKDFLTYLTEGRKLNKDAEKYAEGIGILDKILNNQDIENEEDNKRIFDQFLKPNGPTIYAFKTDKVKDAIKIGYTDQHPMKRIEQWQEVYGKEKGEVECLGYWSSEEFNKAGERVFFWDHSVHNKVTKKGYDRLNKDTNTGTFFIDDLTDKGKQIVDLHYSKEFFRKYKKLLIGNLDPTQKEELSAQLIEDILIQMKAAIKRGDEDFKVFKFDDSGKTSTQRASITWKKPDTYSNTDLQEEAIKNGVDAIKKGKKNLLMAAVMRFGKTHATYEIIKEAGLKKVIVTSGKADVREAWRSDINHIDFYKDFLFVEIESQYKMKISCYNQTSDLIMTKEINIYDDTNIFDLYKDKTIIIFATLADLGGSVKELKKKHSKIFNEEFDAMIVDETHYGSHGNLWKNITKSGNDIEDESDIEDELKEIEKDKQDIKKLDVKFKVKIQVSGTPYYILASNEMIEEDAAIISKVSYTDMMQARDQWNKDHKHEDKTKSPYFGIPTLHKIGLNLNKECRQALSKSSETDSLLALFELKGDKFKYEKEITSLMKGIFGDGSSNTLALLKSKKVEGNKVCKHTIIVLPRIKVCDAMKDLLTNLIDTNERQIIKIVGDHPDITDVKVLNDTLLDLDNHGKKSIILTVNKMLTGVSLPLVDSMIYLKNSKSPQEYDQNIFRLCTRNVRKVNNAEGDEPKLVNMKDNVYLIDFNISNMFNMLANSARMKAAAEGDPRPSRIKELMEQDLDAIPIFCEGQGEIMGKMHEIKSKDLMKVYAGFNANKSISDIASDEIDLFSKLFSMDSFQKLIAEYDIEGDNSKIKLNGQDPGEDEIKIKSGEKPQHKSLKQFSKEKLNIEKITKEKFKAIVKSILYCNLCLDEPYTDIGEFIKDAESNKELKNMLNDFRLNKKSINKIYESMNYKYKEAFNQLLLKISLIADEMKKSEKGHEKFITALSGLGRLGKSEVITPPEIVEKMINKLDASDYKNAESILLVNEKQAEFFYGLYKKFGKDIIKKCKIVPSSEIGKQLSIKMLKSLSLNDYINTNIISLEDVNGDGKININDFLSMNNNDILKENNGKRFDIILSNPPYDNGIHERFLEKYLDISFKVISIQPTSWILSKKKNKRIIQKLNKETNSTYINVIDGAKYFDAGILGQLSINYIDFTKDSKIIINNEIDDYISEYDNYEEITQYSINETYNEIFKKIHHLFEKDNLNNHIYSLWINDARTEELKNKNLPLLRINPIRGNVNQLTGKRSSDFYTLFSNNENEIKSKVLASTNRIFERDKNDKKYIFNYCFIFNNEKERNNFYNYCKTDFCRSCLTLIKNNVHFDRGELKFIPWFDFSDAHFSKSPKEIDDWLFKKYNISDEIRKHIEEILPDYYNIRGNN